MKDPLAEADGQVLEAVAADVEHVQLSQVADVRREPLDPVLAHRKNAHFRTMADLHTRERRLPF